jgi:hypothetical protein
MLAGVATAVVSSGVLVLGGGGAALAAGAYFVPEATEAHWDGAVATVAFQEVNVALEGGATTISVKATAEVDAVCRRGASTLRIHRSATALDVKEYPIGEGGVVAATARVPLEVTGLKVTGYTCVVQRVVVTAVLEDFWTGATLTHKS